VVKVQLPLYSTGSGREALIYDERREHSQMRLLHKHEEKLIGQAVKVFCSAWWDEATGWVLFGRAPDEEW
jgi:hypothetical protein